MLTTKLHDLVVQLDWNKQEADKHWEKEKYYEAQGRT